MRGERQLPRIEVQPTPALVDEKWSMQIVGLEPSQPVTVRARMPDDQNRRWESHAIFAPSAEGVVDLTTQEPFAGSYEGIEPMGLVWPGTRSFNHTGRRRFISIDTRLVDSTMRLAGPRGAMRSRGPTLGRRFLLS